MSERTERVERRGAAERIGRRRFLAAGAVAGAAMVVPRHVLGGQAGPAPSDRPAIAGIGIGGQGGWDLEQLAREGARVVALCDVDWGVASGTFKKYPDARKHRDFRAMLDAEKGIDGVVVGTPDHTHAVASMAAIRAGKHVYCEKPLTRTVHEARALARAAREAKVVTQMGNQGMAFEGNRLMIEWLRDGAIGTVREAHVWSDRPTHKGTKNLYWPQGIDRPKDAPPVPPDLDWDLWLGPAPVRPYHPAYHPFRWRGWWDFGSGGLGDMGIHDIAPVFAALDLDAPSTVHGSSTAVYPETVPLASVVHYEFPARGGRPALELHWYDGGILPPRPRDLEDGRELDKEDGAILIGDKGAMLVEGWGGERPMLIPESRMGDYRQPPKTLPRSIGHHKEWVEAIKGNGTCRSSFDFAGPLTEAVLLGMVSVRLGGRKLLWDAANLKVTNCPEANGLLHYEYRKGWTL
jgi:predicted dehydrogenase